MDVSPGAQYGSWQMAAWCLGVRESDPGDSCSQGGTWEERWRQLSCTPSTDGCAETPRAVSTKWEVGGRVTPADPKGAIFLPAGLPLSHIYIHVHSLSQQTGAGCWQMRQTQARAALSSGLHVYLRLLPLGSCFGPDTYQWFDLRDMGPPGTMERGLTHPPSPKAILACFVSFPHGSRGARPCSKQNERNRKANGCIWAVQKGGESGRRSLSCPHTAICIPIQTPVHCPPCSSIPLPLP